MKWSYRKAQDAALDLPIDKSIELLDYLLGIIAASDEVSQRIAADCIQEIATRDK